jgi:hypothetical protein
MPATIKSTLAGFALVQTTAENVGKLKVNSDSLDHRAAWPRRMNLKDVIRSSEARAEAGSELMPIVGPMAFLRVAFGHQNWKRKLNRIGSLN